MPTFEVRNAMLFRVINLFGRILAPAQVGGRTNSARISLEQLLDATCVEHIKTGRLSLVGSPPPELLALLADPVDEVVASAEPTPAAKPPPIESEPAVEPLEEAPAASDVVSAPVVPVVESPKYTEASLLAYKAEELRDLAQSYGLETSGSKKELAARILGVLS